jgi:hypothetical protein
MAIEKAPKCKVFLDRLSSETERLYFSWTIRGALVFVFLTAMWVDYLTNNTRNDIDGFRLSLIECLGGPSQFCEPLKGNPVGSSESEDMHAVAIYQGIGQSSEWTLLFYNDLHFRLRVRKGIVDTFIFSGRVYSYKGGVVQESKIGRGEYPEAFKVP